MVRTSLGISFAVALGAACLPAYANEGSSDAVPPAYNHNYYNAPGPDLASGDSDAPNGVVGTFLFISGNAFTPLTGTQSVSNSGYGCSASYATLTTDLTLPDAAEVTGIRVYYYNDGSPNNFITVRLIAYTGDGSDTTYITGFAGDDNGYRSQYFSPTNPIPIDLFAHSYVLTALAPSGMSICGVRVQYLP